MSIHPRHLAAVQYTIVGMFALATWSRGLFPVEGARGRLDSMFAGGDAHREFFAMLALANALTAAAAAAFWFERAASPPLARILVLVSFALLAWALWQSNVTLILVYALGCVFSVWSWQQPNLSLNRDAKKRAS